MLARGKRAIALSIGAEDGEFDLND